MEIWTISIKNQFKAIVTIITIILMEKPGAEVLIHISIRDPLQRRALVPLIWSKFSDFKNEGIFTLTTLIVLRGPIFTIFAATALITVGYILLMRWFAKLLVYFVIILICICLVAGTIFGTVKFAQEHKQEQLVMAISCAFIFVVIFIALLFLRRKINIACGVITESMK